MAELTVAVVMKFVPVPGATALIVIGLAGPTGKDANVQVTTPNTLLHTQPVPEAETNAAPAGKFTSTLTEFAAEVPRLDTVTVYWIGPFAMAGFLSTARLMPKSEDAVVTKVDSVALLLVKLPSGVTDWTLASFSRVPAVPGDVTTI